MREGILDWESNLFNCKKCLHWADREIFYLSESSECIDYYCNFYFAINTSQRKLCKAWKIANLLNLNINLTKKKQQKKQTG